MTTLQERIVDHLREIGGDIAHPSNVAQKIATNIGEGSYAGRVRDALGALEARGVVKHTLYHVTLVEAANGSAAKAESDGSPNAKASGGQGVSHSSRSRPSPAPPAPPNGGSGEMQKESVIDRVIAVLNEQGGSIEDPNGRCADMLAKRLDVTKDAITGALGVLARRGVITKDSRRGAGGGTTTIRIAKGDGVDGQVPVVSSGAGVGAHGERSTRTPRRKAGAAPRAKATKRRAGGGSGAKGRPAAKRGGRRPRAPQGVDEPLRDVPARGGAPQVSSVADELVVVRTIVDAFDGLSDHSQQWVVSALAEKVLGRP